MNLVETISNQTMKQEIKTLTLGNRVRKLVLLEICSLALLLKDTKKKGNFTKDACSTVLVGPRSENPENSEIDLK